jgi:hypothetical protein
MSSTGHKSNWKRNHNNNYPHNERNRNRFHNHSKQFQDQRQNEDREKKESKQESSGPLNLPGYYWDSEKNRYFKIESTSNTSSLFSIEKKSQKSNQTVKMSTNKKTTFREKRIMSLCNILGKSQLEGKMKMESIVCIPRSVIKRDLCPVY